MTLEVYTGVCMLDRAVYANELFRFSTTDQKWEQLDATRVSGSPPSARAGHGMVSVESDIYVFAGLTEGEEGCAMMVIVWVHAR